MSVYLRGEVEDDNQVVRTWGTPPVLDFEPKDPSRPRYRPRHPRLSGCSQDLRRHRFSVLKGGRTAGLSALINFFVDQGVANGYREVMVLHREPLQHDRHRPGHKFEADAFKVVTTSPARTPS